MPTEDYQKLTRKEVSGSLKKLKRWRLLHGKLHREYNFGTFEDAISFIVRSSLEVAKLNHHPEWFNVYNKVVVDLVTHDVGGISNYDFILSRKLEKISSSFGAK